MRAVLSKICLSWPSFLNLSAFVSILFKRFPSLLNGVQGTLLGCPVYTTPNLEAVGTSKECIIFGDFRYYQIVDKMGIKILRDPYTAKPFVRFYTTKKVGGDVVKTEAFKILRTSSYNG